MLTAFLCAALSYPKKASEGLLWVNDHPTSETGGWFHHRVNDWVENVRANTRLWSCALAFALLVSIALNAALVVRAALT